VAAGCSVDSTVAGATSVVFFGAARRADFFFGAAAFAVFLADFLADFLAPADLLADFLTDLPADLRATFFALLRAPAPRFATLFTLLAFFFALLPAFFLAFFLLAIVHLQVSPTNFAFPALSPHLIITRVLDADASLAEFLMSLYMTVEHGIDAIVKRAQQLGPRERADFVRTACGQDPTLLSGVLVALGKDAEDPEFWNEPSNETLEPLEASAGLEGQRLGPYRIERKLGSGGMGDVYLAERADDEYQQRVAIKLVRAGVYWGQVQSRLRMERQILARLTHPNIARLLDGGRAPDGTPYLVMEYVDGEPIDSFCDRRRLDLPARMALVRTVCAAVHYAHQNLIVHRDLKPNNILITPEGVPKLLDFGIAKLLDTRQSLHTLAVTHMDYRVMTPAHASPEQIRGDVITTSSDIYVLGVLLYELLTGRRPFQLVGSRITDMEKIICDQDPVPPSEMAAKTLQESPDMAFDIAACRSSTPHRLVRDLRGDIDNIILMSMRKDARRRYGSAEQLADDLERHATRQPVTATRDTWAYRSRQFVRRHAVGVAAAAFGLALLMAFALITFLQAQRIARERDIAATQRVRAEQVSSFLVELFELSDPTKSRGNQVTARELLDIGARRVSTGLDDQPETRATLLGTIGRVYGSLGLFSDAISLQKEALESRRKLFGPRHAEVAVAMAELGDALREQGQYAEAERNLTAAHEMQRELLGARAVELVPTLMSLGKLAMQQGALDTAQRFYEQGLDIYRQHRMLQSSSAASVFNDLAGLLLQRGQYDRAAQLYRTALDIDRTALGQDHPQVAMHIQNLALTLHRQGKLAEAAPLYVESLQLLQRVLGDRHPHTLDALANYGNFLRRNGELARAETVLRDVLARNQLARGARHVYVGHDHVNLGHALLDANRTSQAELEYRAALDIYQETLPEEHAFVAAALSGLGRAQLAAGRPKQAEETLRRAVTTGVATLPSDSTPLILAKNALGMSLLEQGRHPEAAPLLRETYPMIVKTQGADSAIARRAKEALERVEASVEK
jgi:serine/threonine protein kinase/tetratricopeptide (TPR) repeat protein